MRKMLKQRQFLSILLVFTLLVSVFGINEKPASGKIWLSKVKVTNKKKAGYVTVKEKKKLQLKFKVNGKKLASKKIAKTFRFKVSNKRILSVDKKGIIKGKKLGKCKLYVMLPGSKKKKIVKVKVIKNAMKNPEQPVGPGIKPVLKETKAPEISSMPEMTGKPKASKAPALTEIPQAKETPKMSEAPDSSTAPEETKLPEFSKEPVVTKAPESSKEPVVTKVPDSSKEPVVTKVPVSSMEPEETKVPVATRKPVASTEPVLISENECKDLEIGGKYAGEKGDLEQTAVALYANGDCCSTEYTFEEKEKKYRIEIVGASSNESAAGVSVYVGEKKVGTVYFSGTSFITQTIDFKKLDNFGTQTIRFILETDNGANDTYIHSYKLYDLGEIPPLPAAPTPASIGAAVSGQYRNLFTEYGLSQEEVDEKVQATWQQLFYGDEDERIYYPVGDDMAYIYTADTDDVRSEGMSYGMMICVQMNKKNEFDRLWKWAKTYMQHTSGEFKDYFAWKMGKNGNKMDNTPASDGEEYFATALLFASARWGDGEGIYNYNAEAQKILNAMLHQADDKQGVNMFDKEHKMPVFCPIGNAASYSDPSYHLPAFYEIWAIEAEQDNDFWAEAAQASRQHFKNATNAKTGLGPDYSEYNGSPKNEGDHKDFRYDAWRIAANISCDYAWWGKNSWASEYADRLQAFFYGKGVDSYGNLWSLDGETEFSTDHSPGLVAMNATTGLAATTQKTWAFVEDFWNTKTTTGKYRYYDGCLYMLGLLQCSGNYKVYLSGKGGTYVPTPPESEETAAPSAAPSATEKPQSVPGYDKQTISENIVEQHGITIQDGTITFDTESSYVAIEVDFGDIQPQKITAYVKEPSYGASLSIRAGETNIGTIYNLGNGQWTEISTNLYPKPSGKTKIYIQSNKSGVELKWIQFSK